MGNTSSYILLTLFIPGISFAVLPDSLAVTVDDVTGDGQADHLILTKRSLRASTYRVYTWDPNTGYTKIPAPEVRTYRGYVQEDPDLQVNASVEPGNILQANLADGRDAVKRLGGIPVDTAGPQGTPDPGSGNIVVSRTVNRVSPTPRGYVIPRYTMRQMHIGMDLANDYYAAFGSVEAAICRAEQRVNDSDHFYARDMGMAWEIQECVIRVGGDPGNWKTWWTSQTSAPVNTRIKFKAPGGGGSSGVVFDASDRYHQHTCTVGSTSQYSRSLGHEVGHGFGAGHYSSWDDTMSGANSALGTGTVQRMIDHSHVAQEAAAPAVIYGGDLCPFAMEDGTITSLDQPVEIDLLENDYDGNGDAIALEHFDNTTAKGGSIEIISDGTVRYTPTVGFVGMDEFAYHVSDTGGLTNRNGYVKIYVSNNNIATHILFDETSGSIAHDVGWFQAHGSLTGGLSFTNSSAGKVGLALENTSTDGISASADFANTGDPMDGDLSVSLWVRYPQSPTTDGVLICKGAAVIPSRFNNPRGGWCIGHVSGQGFRFAGNTQRDLWQNTEKFNRQSSQSIAINTWYHLVMVINRSSHSIRAWVNNSEVTNTTWSSYVPDGIIDCGYPLVVFDSQSQQSQGTDTPVIIDDIRIFHKALAASEVSALYNSSSQEDIPAGAPNPKDRSSVESSEYTLSWMPGKPSIYSFDVYLGTDHDAVAVADTDSLEYKGRRNEPNYPATLQPNQEYFWRIDEIRDTTVIPGRVWRFSSASVTGKYQLDFGTLTSPVEIGFAGVVFGQPTSVNWAQFTLTANTTSVTTQTNGGNGDLLDDYVRASGGGAQLILTFGNVQAGDYTLKFYQWLKDTYAVPEKAWLQEQGTSTHLLDFPTDDKSTLPRTVAVSLQSGKAYEFIIQEKNNRNRAYIAGFELIRANTSPEFTSNPVMGTDAAEGKSYSAILSDNVNDPDQDQLIFSKEDGPSWLTIEEDGTVTGIPAAADIGPNVFAIKVTDSSNESDYADLNIQVLNMHYGNEGLVDFAGMSSQWMTTDCGEDDFCYGADISGDGNVNFDDLLLFIQNWLAT